MQTITSIVEKAGGPETVAERCKLSTDQVRRKWPKSGILDRYWDDLIALARERGEELTPEMIYEANCAARGQQNVAAAE